MQQLAETRPKAISWLKRQLWEPMRAMKMVYLPFLMVYFAFGLASLTGIAGSFWVKNVLQFSARDLALAGFWAGVPWTLKMLFGQFVDARPIIGSPRRAYIFIGASLVAFSYLMFAGLAGGWSPLTSLAPPLSIFFLTAVVMATGLVIQDITADAMTAEMNTGDERDARSIQILGRIALSLGGLTGAFLAGTIAVIGREHSYALVYFIALCVPLISVVGALFWKQKPVKRVAWNVPIVVGGFLFAAFVIVISLTSLPGKAEIVLLVNMLVVGALLYFLGRTIERREAYALLAAGAVVFVFRATPSAGDGVLWWQIEVLGFDEEFFGRLKIIGSVMGLSGLILAARSMRNYAIAPVLMFVTIADTVLSLPTLLMYYGVHEWLGVSARTVAIINTAIPLPFSDLSMVPVLAVIAMIARRYGSAATWFALSASFMNLPLSFADLATKWLNDIWIVKQSRIEKGIVIAPGDFSNLGMLIIITMILGFVLPLVMIYVFRKQLNIKLDQTP